MLMNGRRAAVATLALAAAGACVSKESAGRIVDPPLRAANCAPCRIRLSPSDALELRFVADSTAGGSRRLRAVRVRAKDIPERELTFPNPPILARGDSVMVDIVSLGPARRALAVAT